MAQERIAHQRSSVAGAVPDPADVKVGELIINFADRTLRTKNGANAFIRLNQHFLPSAIPPDDPQEGDAYLDTDTGLVMVYVDLGMGVSWNSVSPPEDLSFYLEKSGGTMTGQITLPGGGSGNQAVSVTEATALAAAAVAPALLKAGGTMTGQITLPGGGSANQALRKSEIEALITAAIPPDLSGALLKIGGTMTGQIVLPGGGTGNQAASANELASAIAAHAAQPDPHTAYTLTTELNAHIAAGGAQHPVVTGAVAGFMSAADKTAWDAHVGVGGAAHPAVTTSVNGFMTAADKVILNALAVPGSILNVAYSLATAVATGNVVMPYDDTIPQNTEGNEFITVTITPVSATSILLIDFCGFFGTGGSSGVAFGIALFRDAVVNALAAIGHTVGNAPWNYNGSLSHAMISGGTSPITFKIRAGQNVAGFVTFNGISSVRRYGGVAGSILKVTEIKA